MIKKKHNNKGKDINLQQHQEYHSAGAFWSPRKVRKGKVRRLVNERLADKENLYKALIKLKKFVWKERDSR